MTQGMGNSTTGPQENSIFGLPVSPRIIFSNHKKVYKKGIEKRQTKLMKKITFLKPFLKGDEKILLVTTGCSPVSLLEQLLTGVIVYHIKRSVFVFTDKRIFHIPTTMNYSYRNSIAQILYADCESIEIKGSKLVVKYKRGKKETFLYIARKERKKIKELLKLITLVGEQSKSLERTHLCPRCTNELDKDTYVCQNCHLVFKDRAEAKKISIVYPGGGYFYTRHPFLGAGDAFIEFFLIVLVILSLVDAINGVKGGLEAFIFFAVILVIEKTISVYHSNHYIKEYIPKEKEIKPIPAS